MPRESPGVRGRALLWTMEESHINGFSDDVSLHRFHHVRARLERVRCRRHIQLRIERVDFERVVMQRPGGRRAGPSIDRTARADLMASILEVGALRNAFR